MAPLLTTAVDAICAIHAAATRIPGVSIHLRDHCHGYDWMINPRTLEVHVNGGLDPIDYNEAVAEAIAALQRHLDNAAVIRHNPALPDELAERRRRRSI